MACCCIMRMNLKARGSEQSRNLRDDSIMLTLRPACSLPGEYSFTTSRDSLRRMLLKTDLPSTVLERFEVGIWSSRGASLPAVEISEKTLTEIGYFLE
jgi:hypothetical protein